MIELLKIKLDYILLILNEKDLGEISCCIQTIVVVIKT